MKRFIVTTDSGCDLPLELLRQCEITPIMFSYEMDGVVCKDTLLTEDCRAFHEKMRRGAAPKTSQLNPAEYVDFWRPLLEQGLPIVHISLGSAVSGTWQNGVMAAQMLADEIPGSKIYPVDSTLCSTGYGMLALEAARMRDEGQSPEDCVAWLEENKIRVNTWYTTDTLTYLRRCGRCSRADAVIGTALSICPLLNLDAAGRLVVQERVRTLRRTIARLHELIAASVQDAQNQTLYICHFDTAEKAMEFGRGLKEALGFRDVFYTDIGTIIGANCGPGLMAAFYFGTPRTMEGSE